MGCSQKPGPCIKKSCAHDYKKAPHACITDISITEFLLLYY